VLERMRREDFSCSEAFARLDEYIERQIRGKDAAYLMPPSRGLRNEAAGQENLWDEERCQ